MVNEQIMNQRRLETLYTIRRENPTLRLYMTDLISEMESVSTTGNLTGLSELDGLTTVRLCDAFSVARVYSKKYRLDLSELIEFVSEKTLEIIAEDGESLVSAFKNKLRFLIRQQFPLRNALLSRSAKQNMESYLMYDRDSRNGHIDENGRYYDGFSNENPELNIPILFTQVPHIAYAEMETDLEENELRTQLSKLMLQTLTLRERNVIRLRFGLEGGIAHDLDEVSCHYGVPRERIRQIEAKAIVKLRWKTKRKIHRSEVRLNSFLLCEDVSCTPIGRAIDYTIGAPLMAWPLNQDATQCKYNTRCICGGKVAFKCINNQKTLTCQKCGKVYPVKTKVPSNQ